MGLGMTGLLVDLGVVVEVQINTDSSAAKSIASRRGAGRVRLLEVRELWIQDRVANGELSIVKLKGEITAADISTKHAESNKRDEQHEELRICTKKWSS